MLTLGITSIALVKMQTGWLKDGNTWYSLADSGAMRTGWYKEGNTWYSLADSGAMRTGWYKKDLHGTIFILVVL